MTAHVRAALAALAFAASVTAASTLPAQVPDALPRGDAGGATKGAAVAPSSIAVSRGKSVIFRDPTTFAQLGKVKMEETVQDLRQIGDFTYVLTKCAMYVVDARTPSSPTILARVPFPECTSVRFLAEACPDGGSGACPNEVFIQRGDSVARYALDTTASPPTLTPVDQHSAADVRRHELLAGHKGAVAEGAGGLALVDWSAGAPTVLDRFDAPHSEAVTHVATVGSQVFVPLEGGLQVLDASGSSLAPVSTHPILGASAIAGDGVANRLFVASGAGQIRGYQLPLESTPVAEFSFNFPPPIQDLRVDGDQLFIFTPYAFFAKDPEVPAGKRFAPSAPVHQVLRLPASNPQGQVFANGTGLQGFAFGADDPEFIADTLQFRARRLAPYGDQKSFFASGDTGVAKILFDSGFFAIQGNYPLADARGMDTLGDRVFVATPTGLASLDFTDAANPSQQSSISLTGNPQDVLALGPFVYVASGTAGFHLIDYLSATNPVLLGTFVPPVLERATNDVQGLAVGGDYMAVACGENGFHLYNVTQYDNPTYITGVAHPTNHVRLNSNLLYAGRGDVSIFDITEPTVPVLEAIARTGSDEGGAVGIVTTVNFTVSAGDAGVISFELPPLIKQVLDGVLARSETPYYSDKNGDGVTDAADIIDVVAG